MKVSSQTQNWLIASGKFVQRGLGYLNRKLLLGKKWLWEQRNFFSNRALRIEAEKNSGLPLQPAGLIYSVAGSSDVAWFLNSGKSGADSLRSILQKNRLDISQFENILDFGCGVGRVIRYWKDLQGPKLFGCDYNPKLIRWCQNQLTFAQFQTNQFAGRLDYPDESFDFVYALSVFTHLKEPQQFFWIQELSRIVKPGGYLFITVHGEEYYLPQLLPEDQVRFKQGELVVYGGRVEGKNTCTAFHPDSFVRERMAKDLVVIDHVPQGALGNPKQDVYLLQKPNGDNGIVA